MRIQLGVNMIISRSYQRLRWAYCPQPWIWPSKMGKLIGHNGAGKSATIKSWSMPPTTGYIEVWSVTSIAIGLRSKEESVMWIRRIFSCVSKPMNSGVVCDSYDMSPEEDCDQRLEELLTIFDFQVTAMKWLNPFHGMRQKVFVIAALSGSRYLGLGRTMTGLDPHRLLHLKRMMRQHGSRARRVISLPTS